jgi:multidrug efflux pump subunit AcrA (membrane-fusion protein)
VEADVSEANLESIVAGQPCEIVLDAYPDVRYPASVSKIVPTADRSKATVQVKVAFRSYDSRVLPEMSAKVHFLPHPSGGVADTQPVLTVPGSAVADRGGRTVVYTVDGGKAVEVPVVLGRRLGNFVVIAQGLASGSLVVDSVDQRLRSGTRVQVP